jgi:hypothetical protein
MGALDIPANNLLVVAAGDRRKAHWSIQLVYPPAAKYSLESSLLIAELDPIQPRHQMRDESFIDGGMHARCCNPSSGFYWHQTMQDVCFLAGSVLDHFIRVQAK